jgi:hypothetical protein
MLRRANQLAGTDEARTVSHSPLPSTSNGTVSDRLMATVRVAVADWYKMFSAGVPLTASSLWIRLSYGAGNYVPSQYEIEMALCQMVDSDDDTLIRIARGRRSVYSPAGPISII